MLGAAALLKGRNDSLARSYYRAVIDSFPNTVHANLARSNLDLPLVDIVAEPPHRASAQDTVATTGEPTVSASQAAAGPQADIPRETAREDTVAADSTRTADQRSTEPGTRSRASRPEDVGPPAPWQPLGEGYAPTESIPAAPAPEDTVEMPETEGPDR